MKKIAFLLVVIMVLSLGCAGTLEKGCKELTQISNDINAYLPNAEQLVTEGKMSETDFNNLLEYVDYVEKAKVSACALQQVWED